MPQQFAQPQSGRSTREGERNQQSQGARTDAASEPQAQKQADSLDAVLDDIESTLSTNAEEYVSSFVQKGGE